MNNQKELFKRLMDRANRPGNMTRDLGLTVTEIGEHYALGTIEFVENSVNPRRVVHGGAIFGVMDQMGGLAACSTGYGVVTVNGSIDFLRSVESMEPLTCKATIVKPGRRFTVVESVVTSNRTGKLIAKGSFTYCMMEELKVTIEQVCAE